MYRRVNILRKTLIIHIDGQHRDWKSVTACTLGYILDRTFVDNFEKRVVHNQTTLLEAIEDINNKKTYGACIVVDEAGSSVNKMKYYEDMAQAITESIQILGYLRTIIIFVSPVRGFILASLRQMTHKYFHSTRTSNDFATVQVYDLKYNAYREKMFKAKPKIRMFGNKIIVPRVRFHVAPAWLIEKYQKLELERKPVMLAGMKERGLEVEIKAVKKDVYALLELVKKDPNPYTMPNSKSGKIRFSVSRLRNKLELRQADAMFIKEELESILNAKKK